MKYFCNHVKVYRGKKKACGYNLLNLDKNKMRFSEATGRVAFKTIVKCSRSRQTLNNKIYLKVSLNQCHLKEVFDQGRLTL